MYSYLEQVDSWERGETGLVLGIARLGKGVIIDRYSDFVLRRYSVDNMVLI